MLTISVLKETVAGENRVALVPESVRRLAKQGITILFRKVQVLKLVLGQRTTKLREQQLFQIMMNY